MAGKRGSRNMNFNDTFNFAEIMKQTEAQLRSDEGVFISDQSNPHKIQVINQEALLQRPLTMIEQRMLYNIQKVDTYSWCRGSRGGLDTGFEQINNVLEGGLQPGLILWSGAPNTGKSAIMLQVCKNIAERNDNVYVSYHSLDDSNNELMPRYIACDQQITIAQAKNPERFVEETEIIEKRNEGLKNLYRHINKFGMFDGNDMTSLEQIEEHIENILMTVPESTKIVVAIDSFNDITVNSKQFNNNDARNEYVAKAIKDWTVKYNAIVMCTAHLRKTNGRRPTVDDLKDTITLQYEANLICLCYNEVGVKEENASVYWLHEDKEEKQPVLEVKFGKNKFSSFKGTKFFEFMPDQSYCIEATEEANRRYASLIYQA